MPDTKFVQTFAERFAELGAADVLIFVIAAWPLAVILSLLISYWVIRLAVTHSLRSHEYWKAKTFKSTANPR